jgi:uncharacterized Zn finger protein
MPRIEAEPTAAAHPVVTACPECSGGMTVLKIIPGRAGRGGCEYWTMRCTRCGGIHLDIVEPASGAVSLV